MMKVVESGEGGKAGSRLLAALGQRWNYVCFLSNQQTSFWP